MSAYTLTIYDVHGRPIRQIPRVPMLQTMVDEPTQWERIQAAVADHFGVPLDAVDEVETEVGDRITVRGEVVAYRED